MRTENTRDEEMRESMEETTHNYEHNLNTLDDKPKHLFKTIELVPVQL
jgi:hypothetical protein